LIFKNFNNCSASSKSSRVDCFVSPLNIPMSKRISITSFPYEADTERHCYMPTTTFGLFFTPGFTYCKIICVKLIYVPISVFVHPRCAYHGRARRDGSCFIWSFCRTCRGNSSEPAALTNCFKLVQVAFVTSLFFGFLEVPPYAIRIV